MVAQETALVPLDQRALAQFDVTPEAVAARVEEFKDLHLVPGDAKSYKQVKGAYMTIVHLRNKVDARRKTLGEEARKWTNALSAAAKKLVDPTAPLEARLKAELDAEDSRAAAIEAEKIRVEKARVDTILAKIGDIAKRGVIDPQTPLTELNELFLGTFELEITEGEYMEHKRLAETTKEQAIANIKAGMEKREAWEKGEDERKAEADRLEKMREEQEAERKRLDEERRKLDEEKAKLEADKKAEADVKAKAEREAKEKEEKERKLKEAAEYAERIQPDKKKIINWVNVIFVHARPEIKEKEAKAMFTHALSELKMWADMVIEEAEKL